MLVALLVLGASLGLVLGLIVLSMLADTSIAGLSTPHPVRPARERRPHVHSDVPRAAPRFPSVPPPLAPATETPKVLDVTDARALPPPATAFQAPAIPSFAAPSFVTPLVSASTSPVAAPGFVAPPAPAPVPTPGSVAAPAVAAAARGPAFVPFEAPPPLPRKQGQGQKASAVSVSAQAIEAIAGDAVLQELLRQGHLIPALKRYREQHGVGLAEAKAAIAAWRARSGRNDAVADAVEDVVDEVREVATDPQIVAAIKQGRFIEAIKLYRAKTGVSLQDAKEAIDTWRRQLGR